MARLRTKTNCSVSSEAAGVLAGLLPMDLEIELRNKNFVKEGEPCFSTNLPFRECPIILHSPFCIWISGIRTSGKIGGTYPQSGTPHTNSVPMFVCTGKALLPRTFFLKTQVLNGRGKFDCHLRSNPSL